MKPNYFPFTYISTPIVQAIHSCFGQTVVYQPSISNIPEEMLAYEKKGLIDICVPIKKDQEKLEAALKDYAVWADLHGGDKTSFISFQRRADMHVEDSSILKIRNEIKRHREKSSLDQEPDYLLNARIFLCFAQELDVRNIGIDTDISIIDEMEQKLMDDLRGEMGINHKKGPGIAVASPNDPGIHMPSERLSAWIRLFLYQSQQENNETPGIFITGSRAVFELLTDPDAASEIIVDLPLISSSGSLDDRMLPWQKNLLEKLNKTASSSWPVDAGELGVPLEAGKGHKPFSLKICVVPDQNPIDFFSQYCNSGSCLTGVEKHQSGTKNTLIGLIEI